MSESHLTKIIVILLDGKASAEASVNVTVQYAGGLSPKHPTLITSDSRRIDKEIVGGHRLTRVAHNFAPSRPSGSPRHAEISLAAIISPQTSPLVH